MAKRKALWMTAAILGIIGGVFNALNAIGTNLLPTFGSYAPWVQGIVGVGGVMYIWRTLR